MPVWQKGPLTLGVNQAGAVIKAEIPAGPGTLNLGMTQPWDGGGRTYGILYGIHF